MADILVTRASIDDVERIAPLFDQYRQFYRQESDVARARSFLSARLEAEQSVIFLAADTETGDALAFTQLYPAFSSVRMRRVWILNDLFVIPTVRRRGAASMLLEAAAEFAKSTDAALLQLETEVGNSVARSLYEREGWMPDESCVHYVLEV